MERYKRYGNYLKPYTEWNKRDKKICFYCGEKADSREHIPPKVFLQNIKDADLDTLPACTSCNNSFSSDENYIACYMEYLNRKIDQSYSKNAKFDEALDRDLILKKKIDEEINACDSLNDISFDSYKFYRVFEKIARGHAAYMADCICINEEIKKMQVKRYLNLLFKMSDKEIEWFNALRGKHILLPEVCCRSYDLLEEYGDVYPWITIEENKYKYNVTCYSDCFIVKIIMHETLFCAYGFFYE